jgi:hypothetical protein
LALIEPLAFNEGSEFAWSLPHGDRPLPLPALVSLLHHSGVRWLKYPLWYSGGASDKQIDQFLAFNDRLNSHGIDVVGVLSRPTPPPTTRPPWWPPTCLPPIRKNGTHRWSR